MEKSSTARTTPAEAREFRAVRPGRTRLSRGVARPVGVGASSPPPAPGLPCVERKENRIRREVCPRGRPHPGDDPGRPPRHAPGGSEKGR